MNNFLILSTILVGLTIILVPFLKEHPVIEEGCTKLKGGNSVSKKMILKNGVLIERGGFHKDGNCESEIIGVNQAQYLILREDKDKYEVRTVRFSMTPLTKESVNYLNSTNACSFKNWEKDKEFVFKDVTCDILSFDPNEIYWVKKM